MAGKVIIHTPSSMGPMGKFNIYIDGEKVAAASRGEVTTLPVHSDCKLQVRCSADMKTSPLPLSAKKLTEIDFEPGLFGIKPVILRQEDYDSANEDEAALCEIRKVLDDCRNGKLSPRNATDKFCKLQQNILVWTNDIEHEIAAINDELCELYEAEGPQSGTQSTNNDTNEHRMRCNVCGHIFCYTDEDVKKNAGNAGMSALTAIGGLASALGGGSIFHTHHLQGQADRYADKLVDYTRCPSCNSNNISEMKEEAATQPASAPVQTVSPIEEIKKYKELLDMGIITQEEFDKKKKQLLDL